MVIKSFFRRAIDKKWCGPARVIGIDSSIAFIRHGGQVLRIHITDLQHASLESQTEFELTEETMDNNNNRKLTQIEVPCSPLANQEQNLTNDEFSDEERIDCDDNEGNGTVEANNIKPAIEKTLSTWKKGLERPKRNDFIEFVPMDTKFRHETFRAKVLNPAGKATGKYKNCWNIEYHEPERLKGQLANLDIERDVDSWQTYENVEKADMNEIFIADSSNADRTFDEAKMQELASWKAHEVVKEVENCGQDLISVRWVLTMRENGIPGSFVPKARLVVRGFEESQFSKAEKESPVVSRELIKLFLSVLSGMRWRPYSMDVKTAFLQGNSLERPLFVAPPKEAQCPENVIWQLLKPVYGLQDASKKWFLRVKDELESLGFKMCPFEPAMFV